MKKAQTQKGRVQNFIVRTASEARDLEMMQPLLNIGKAHAEWAAKCIRDLRKRATKCELSVAKFLWAERVVYIAQCPFQVEGRTYFADFYIPALKLVVEIDGSGHDSPQQFYYDRERDALLESIGISTLRITNREVRSGEYKGLIPIPPEQFLFKRPIVYLKEGESANGRESVRKILGYK